jgi:hypothetical protein
MPAPPIRALLAGAIDYAGLFPPASLELAPALANHGRYVHDQDAWMLGTFVLPIGRFEEVADSLTPFDVEHRLRISALGPKTETADEFKVALRKVTDAIRGLYSRHGAIAGAAQIEIALPSRPGATIDEVSDVLGDIDLPTFLEAPFEDAERVIDFLAEHRNGGSPQFGFKLRTGGVVASAFPSSVQIARTMLAAIKARVPIKFTAGLHHPVRKFHSSVQTKMHGFLNVLGAGVMAAEHEWNVPQTAAMLDEEDADAFECDDESFRWRTYDIPADRIKAHREVITSFGSCSFDEPREDLRALGLM